MNIQQFKKMANRETINTCNGWGFGGYYGRLYTLGNLGFRQAKWSYRHINPTKYDGYFIENKEVNRGEFLTKIEDIKYESSPTQNTEAVKFVSKIR